VNECNNLEYNIVDQLITRTRKIVWMDWNPSTEFWFYTEMLGKRDDIDFITLTYLDNEALDAITVKEIESHKHNKNWWQVYGLGQLGVAEGRIYKNWNLIDDIPFEAKLYRRGLDFGYTNDPSALVDVYQYNGGYILDEAFFQKGMSNKDIADAINALEEKCLVIADSSEPKSIDEIRGYGVLILPAKKGQGSVNQGIQLVQQQKITVTKRSLNVLKEYRNYLWQKDKDNNILNVPEEGFDHSMDAIRYALGKVNQAQEAKQFVPSSIVGRYGGRSAMPVISQQ
jgi:phage terminase large subunit